MVKVPAEGPSNAKFMIVGEAPGAHEEFSRRPFVGPSGELLNKMLVQAGVRREDCFVTNLSKFRPPGNDLDPWIATSNPLLAAGLQELEQELRTVRPQVVLALGGHAFQALRYAKLTPEGESITHWRGSQLDERLSGLQHKLLPTLHPAAVLRQWSWKRVVQQDIRRAFFRPWVEPARYFSYNMAFDSTLQMLNDLRVVGKPVTFDIETRGKQITCAGIGWSATEAFCIPFIRRDGSRVWSEWHEAQLVGALNRLLVTVPVWGQNLLYDSQYTWRRWRFVPRIAFDTMIGWHSLYSQLKKSLDFIASMLCEHYVQWKGEGTESDTGLWRYNCLDCCYTYEVAARLIELANQRPDVCEAQQKLIWPVLTSMIRGVRVSEPARLEMLKLMEEEFAKGRQVLDLMAGHPLNPNSPKKMKAFFYDDLKQQKVIKDGKPTVNEDALMKIGMREPLLRPITSTILDMRSARVYAGAFLNEENIDEDGRIRCAYNIGGSASGESAPYTYRLSSNSNAWDTGGNLQTIPSDKSKSHAKAKQRGSRIAWPNVRRMYVPDPGMTFFNGDLDRADLQVVVWEAGDEGLKAALRAGVDMHLMNAFVLAGRHSPPQEELVKGHPAYAEHLGPLKELRERGKQMIHGTNYAGGARTIAIETGQKIAVVEEAQERWFAAHPKIKTWHDRTLEQVKSKGYVENRFGYRWAIFDRLDEILPEALAWIPQSTVAVLINRIWAKWHEELPEVEMLLQVHDSLAGQFPTVLREELLPRMMELARVTIPYDDPLTIPFSLGVSETSWGDCE